MPSQNRVEAGHRNGALAKGKKSEESRQKCAMNSVRHGLTAKAIVLSNESKEGFEALRKTYYARFQPADEVECDLVDDMVSARWRIRRAESLERVTIDVRQDRMMDVPPANREYRGEVTEPLRIMLAFEKEFNGSDTLRLCARYETRLHRNFERAGADLRRLQKERRTLEQSEETDLPRETVPPNATNPPNATDLPNERNAPPEPPPNASATPTKIVMMPAPQPKLDEKPPAEEPVSPVTPHRE